jgi:hypothetical protein
MFSTLSCSMLPCILPNFDAAPQCKTRRKYPHGCNERFMQENGKSPAFAYRAYIDVYVHALARDHETWLGGESRRRDWLRRVPPPLEGRLLCQVATHRLSCFLGLRGMARAAASTTCIRRPAKTRKPPTRFTKTPSLREGCTKATGNAFAPCRWHSYRQCATSV